MIEELEKSGFVNRCGKSSHKNFAHISGIVITISGNPEDDAKAYQEKLVKQKIQEIKNETKR